jgi:multicomponent Na+:H+ antiporter subunit D
MTDPWIPLAAVGLPFLTGIAIFMLDDRQVVLRSLLNLFGAFAKLVLVGVMLWGVANGRDYGVRLAIAPGLDVALNVDALALLFITSTPSVIWRMGRIAVASLDFSACRYLQRPASRWREIFPRCSCSTRF